MKVDGPRPIDSLRSASRARATGGAVGGFAPESLSEPKAAGALSGSVSIASVDALIALQQVPEATTGRAKAVRRGRDMLDLLDEVRDGLLSGSVSRATLQRLLALVSVKREQFVDPGLQAVLDDIDLRARVELAKLNFAAAN
jgi:hypothetical protein